MPAWLIAIMSQLPNIAAEIMAILQAMQTSDAAAMSPAQNARLMAHLNAVHGINSVALYYASVAPVK